MSSNFTCPKCSAKVIKEDGDKPGCTCCGYGTAVSSTGSTEGKAKAPKNAHCCSVCNESTCTKHILCG